jgi:hypothetical protein
MRLKKLLNKSEYRTLAILDKALEQSGFRVFTKVAVKDVIYVTDAELRAMSNEERNMFFAGHFDFACLNVATSDVAFVVEFDGPRHVFDEVQIRRDLIKNRLCQESGLRIIRIGTDRLLEEFDEVSVLEYMIGRFVAWDREQAEIEQEIDDYIANLSPSDPLLEGPILDPLLDSTFIFHLHHPFPGTLRVCQRLFEEFGMLTGRESEEAHSQVASKGEVLKCQTSPAFTSFKEGGQVLQTVSAMLIRWPPSLRETHWSQGHVETPCILYQTRRTVRMQNVYFTDEDVKEPLVEDYYETGRIRWLFAELPGASIPDIAECIAEYLALRDVERWARANLR